MANRGIGADFEPMVWLYHNGPDSIPSKAVPEPAWAKAALKYVSLCVDIPVV